MAQHTKIEKTEHKDKRTNIPTEETRGFVSDDEKAPKPVRYPRDPSLDPQLVWTGKDEQGNDDLEVDSVPIYIQETIQPQAIIENLRAAAQADRDQFDFFNDFNGLELAKLLDFYKYEQNWSNRMILGDSLLVMNSLAEKERLKGLVQMIYIDPPYGIKFGSNWQPSTRKRDVKDGKAEDVTRQPEQIKAYRDTWKNGIHSYLSYLRDRLTVARELLTESGSVFVQIGDENVHLVRCLMDEVFGRENFCRLITFKKTTGRASSLPPSVYNYIIWFAKNIEQVKSRTPPIRRSTESEVKSYTWLETLDGGERRASSKEKNNVYEGSAVRRFMTASLVSSGTSKEGSKPFNFRADTFFPAAGTHWKTHAEGLTRLNLAARLVAVGKTLSYKRYADDYAVMDLDCVWNDTVQSTFAIENIYAVQTYTKVIQRCLLMTTDPGDLVLDPTCGGGTTALVAESWGRRWITIDTSRVALALARTRLMEGKYPYYLLADSPEGVMKEAELMNDPDRAVNAETSVKVTQKKPPSVWLGGSMLHDMRSYPICRLYSTAPIFTASGALVGSFLFAIVSSGT